MPIARGVEGEPLPSEAEVFRLFRATNDGKFPPEAFYLSSKDKAQPIPRLSVWETTNTLEQSDALTAGREDGARWISAGCRHPNSAAGTQPSRNSVPGS